MPLRSSARSTLVAVCLLLGVGLDSGTVAAAKAESPLPACAVGGDWQRFDGEHFVLYTNASPQDGAEHARQLDRFARVFYRRQPALQTNGAPPIRAYGLAGKDCYDPFRTVFDGRPVETVGLFITGPFGSHFQFLLRGDPRDARIIQHEYMHALSYEQMRGAPLSVSEGLADFYSTMFIQGTRAKFGHPLTYYCRLLSGAQPLTMDQLYGIGFGRDYFEGANRAVFYAQSWATVHYLAATGQRERLDDFIAATHRGASPGEEFARRFPGEDWNTLPARVKRAVSVTDLNELADFTLEMGGEIVDGPIETRPVPRVEALTVLGDLLLDQGRTGSTDAQAFYTAALELQPRHGAALAGLATINQSRNYPKEALELFARAARDSGNDGATWVRIGRGHAVEAGRDSGALARRDPAVMANLASARAAAERALRSSPADRDAVLLLVHSLLGDTAATVEATGSLRAAHDRLKRETEVADALVGAYLLRDRIDDAEMVAAATYGSDRSRDDRRWCDAQILNWNLARVDTLMKAGQFDEAGRELKELRATTSDPQQRASLDSRLNWIARQQVGNPEVDRFNEGIALANKGRLDAALVIFDDLGAHADEPALLLKAREMSADIRKYQSQQRAAKKR